jgi:2-dehydro-3-deoxyphosphogluconate aldolase/(4S)-4-hydroxy-2-oxoglutarate aldolase
MSVHLSIHPALKLIREIGVLPVVRLDDLSYAENVAAALADGGVPVAEFTLTSPGAVKAIAQVREREPDVLVGAGTVLDRDAAEACVDAGAQFLVTPALRPEVIAVGREHHVPIFCGSLTPTEVLEAWDLGAACVKIFPAGPVGPAYLRALREPFPHIRLMPSGGVRLENTPDFIRAGAIAVSVGGQLVDQRVVAERNWYGIGRRAAHFLAAVREAREGGGTR